MRNTSASNPDTDARRAAPGRPTNPPCDRREIEESLRLLLGRDQVFEVRALGVSSGRGRPHVEFGYFDCSELAAEFAARLSDRGASGVYFTLNPVDPDLLARSANRLRRAGSGDLTSDEDIVERQLLLVDLDPRRKSGISATEEEHEAALARAKCLAESLAALGWPTPALVDSGNGAHLYYRVELPADDEGLVARVLTALSEHFTDEHVEVDTKVANPARISKVPGTWARKGDSTPSRPHRRARLLSAPERLELVERSLLEELAAQVTKSAPRASGGPVLGTGAWIDEWIARHGLPVSGPHPYKGGRKWLFSDCPWDEHSAPNKAFITESTGGTIGAGCVSCEGKSWRELRALVEGRGVAPASAPPEARVIVIAGDSPQSATRSGSGAPKIPELAAAIVARGFAFARDPGGKLYVYRGGVYQPDGEECVREQVKRCYIEWEQADTWRTRYASELVAYLTADAPRLWECPPGDRLNLHNGLLHLETRTLEPHTPEYLSTVQLPIDFDPEASCPNWEWFVASTFPEDSQRLAWEIPAWCLMPDLRMQKAVLLLGSGGNGKSRYHQALTAFLGRENVSFVDLQRLESDRFAAANVYGKLANIASDLPARTLEETSMLKSITGGDTILAERKHQHAFSFTPFAKLVFAANQAPRSSDRSQGYFDRWVVLRFEGRFRGTQDEITADEIDARLAQPSELSGVLNRALAVLPDLRQRGFSSSESLCAGSEEFRRSVDPTLAWLEANFSIDPDRQISKSEVIAEHKAAVEEGDLPDVGPHELRAAILRWNPAAGESQRTYDGRRKVRVWLGFGLRSPEMKGQEE